MHCIRCLYLLPTVQIELGYFSCTRNIIIHNTCLPANVCLCHVQAMENCTKHENVENKVVLLNLFELLKIFYALDTSEDHFQFVVLQKSKFGKTNAIFVRNIYSFLNVNGRTVLWFQCVRSAQVPFLHPEYNVDVQCFGDRIQMTD